jgi:hypothetical protein
MTSSPLLARAHDLARTRLVLEITGRAHALLELLSESADSDTKSKP